MGRSQFAKKARRSSKPAQATSSTPTKLPTAEQLIERAHDLLAQSNFQDAIQVLLAALALDENNLEVKELLGVAELEGGDVEQGRQYLLQLFPPHTSATPSQPSPYLYLAQSAEDPTEALKYYTLAVELIESKLSSDKSKNGPSGEEELRQQAVDALVAMIEIWMSDLCMEEGAESQCETLISRALELDPTNPEVRLSLASIRMSQARSDDAKQVVISLYTELQNKEPFDETLPSLPARLHLIRLLLEHEKHLQALEMLTTVREEDELLVEGAYLEGWALYLRAQYLASNPPASIQTTEDGEAQVDGPAGMSAAECLEEASASLFECAKLYTDQDYDDEGIGAHVAELLKELEEKGVKPVRLEEDEDEEAMDGDGAVEGDWEDLEEGGKDVDMA
ncbi:hypothetical protein BCR39DRAFT_565306 [Naematelia encephala]|uniref:TPR domain-containing protein n=1 Tax=Naematelia encephala TaxID=71784 RepID=A0A1Y2B3Z7_9TREE|nr:hypothetical protein BCR39DRAFT_565306 [Naematelia encephala]